MNKQNIRLFLWGALLATGMMLFSLWQQEHEGSSPAVVSTKAEKAREQAFTDVPEAPIAKRAEGSNVASVDDTPSNKIGASQKMNRLVVVKTDVFSILIDSLGGDVVSLHLNKYPKEAKEKEHGFVMFDSNGERDYIAQSGLLSDAGPDSRSFGRAQYSFGQKTYSLYDGDDALNVDLTHTTKDGVKITKRYGFKRDSYEINVEYIVNNQSDKPYSASMYGRLRQKEGAGGGRSLFGAVRSYVGAAVNTPEKAYKKLPFDDMEDEPFKQTVSGGWIAMVEHYFTSAWIPAKDAEHQYVSEKLGQDTYGVRFINAEPLSVSPGATKTVAATLFAGPEITDMLKDVSPGLELTVDYGILWPIAQPIFWLLKNIHKVVGNWGWAIIFTTLVIKLLFYHLSAASYRSMGNMRRLQPRIATLKERFGEDKQQFGKAVMELYKREKVNPLGGCLPILVQIPVFISLYYVLLESVELRQAPFALWLTDLSAKDPFYVLPIIMGASMLLQQKLSPAPPDPMQAKMMMAMPIVFTFLFLQFPSGLVLYWVVNNVLSIIQQWYIMRSVEKSATIKKH